VPSHRAVAEMAASACPAVISLAEGSDDDDDASSSPLPLAQRIQQRAVAAATTGETAAAVVAPAAAAQQRRQARVAVEIDLTSEQEERNSTGERDVAGVACSGEGSSSPRPSKRNKLLKREWQRLPPSSVRHPCSTSYTARRAALNSEPRLRLGRRADPRHTRCITEDDQGTFGDPLPVRTLPAAEAHAFRAEMIALFGLGPEHAAYVQEEGNLLDQSAFAACSFAGFLQLLNLSSAIHSLDELVPACARGPAGGAATAADTGCGGSWAWWVENWASRWTEMLESQQADGGSEPHVADIASMLDLLPGGLWRCRAPAAFVYVPVRSAGNAEMSFERSWWRADEEVACGALYHACTSSSSILVYSLRSGLGRWALCL
jgi:hypothetical protein